MKNNKIFYIGWLLLILNILSSCIVQKQKFTEKETALITHLSVYSDSIIMGKTSYEFFNNKLKSEPDLTYIFEKSVSFKYGGKSDSLKLLKIDHDVEYVQFYYSYRIQSSNYYIFIPININSNGDIEKNIYPSTESKLEIVSFIDEKEYYLDIDELKQISKEKGFRFNRIDVMEVDGNFYWVLIKNLKSDALLVQIDNHLNTSILSSFNGL